MPYEKSVENGEIRRISKPIFPTARLCEVEDSVCDVENPSLAVGKMGKPDIYEPLSNREMYLL